MLPSVATRMQDVSSTYVVQKRLIRACCQFLVVWKGSEMSAKSVKGKVHKEPNGESVVRSGMEKRLSSYLPQGV